MTLTNVRLHEARRRLGSVPSIVATLALVLGMSPVSAAGHASGAAMPKARAATAQSGATAQKPTLDITFKSQPDPVRAGENTFEVTVKGAAGKPVTDAAVSVAFRMPAMPEMKMPEMKNSVTLKHQKEGLYRGSGQVMMAGQWEVTVAVKRAGKEIGSKKLSVTAK